MVESKKKRNVYIALILLYMERAFRGSEWTVSLHGFSDGLQEGLEGVCSVLRLYIEAGMSTGFFYERENYGNTCIQRFLRLFYVIDG